MTGNTVLTTLPSRADMNVPTPTVNRIHHRRADPGLSRGASTPDGIELPRAESATMPRSGDPHCAFHIILRCFEQKTDNGAGSTDNAHVNPRPAAGSSFLPAWRRPGSRIPDFRSSRPFTHGTIACSVAIACQAFATRSVGSQAVG